MRTITLLFLLFLSSSLTMAQMRPDLFVSSRNDSTVKRYDGETGMFLGNFTSFDSSGLDRPQEVLFHSSGDLLVTGRGNPHVLRFDIATGAYLGPFTSGYALDNPTKTRIGPDGYLYISQWGTFQNKVVRFDAETGVFVDEFTSQGIVQGCGHAWDSEGNLYVANFGNSSQGNIQKFDTAGVFQEIFIPTGQVLGPTNLWFGKNGELHVVDFPLGKIARFDGQDGSFLGNLITNISNPEGYVFDDEGNLYLSDWTGNIVLQYDSTGSFLGTFANTGGMMAPNSLAFGPGETTSLDQTRIDFQLAIHQPDSERLLLRGNTPAFAQFSLQILSLKGEMVAYEDRPLPGGTFEWSVPTQGIVAGIYVLRLQANGIGAQAIKIQIR